MAHRSLRLGKDKHWPSKWRGTGAKKAVRRTFRTHGRSRQRLRLARRLHTLTQHFSCAAERRLERRVAMVFTVSGESVYSRQERPGTMQRSTVAAFRAHLHACLTQCSSVVPRSVPSATHGQSRHSVGVLMTRAWYW